MFDFSFYHNCPLCGCLTDDGDSSGICFYCLDRYDYLSSHSYLSDEDKLFLDHYCELIGKDE